jgi:adhesin transport system outer membrane protein
MIRIVLIFLIGMTILNANTLKAYSIQVGTYKSLINAKKIQMSFDIYQPHIKQVGQYHVVEIESIKTIEDAKNILNDIKVVEKSAYIKSSTIEQEMPPVINNSDEQVKTISSEPKQTPKEDKFTLVKFFSNIINSPDTNQTDAVVDHTTTIDVEQNSSNNMQNDPILKSMLEHKAPPNDQLEEIATNIKPIESHEQNLTNFAEEANIIPEQPKEKFTLFGFFKEKTSASNENNSTRIQDAQIVTSKNNETVVEDISLEQNATSSPSPPVDENQKKIDHDPILAAMLENQKEQIITPMQPIESHEQNHTTFIQEDYVIPNKPKEKFTLFGFFKEISDHNSSTTTQERTPNEDLISSDSNQTVAQEYFIDDTKEPSNSQDSLANKMPLKADITPLPTTVTTPILLPDATVTDEQAEQKFTLFDYFSKKIKDFNLAKNNKDTNGSIESTSQREIVNNMPDEENLSMIQIAPSAESTISITEDNQSSDLQTTITNVMIKESENNNTTPKEKIYFKQPLITDLDGNEKQAITFYRAIMRALEHNPTVKASFELLEQSTLKIQETKSGYYPQGTMSATSEYYKKEQQITGKDDYVKHYGNLKIKQMIYDGGELKHKIEQKEFDKVSNDYKYQNVIEDEILEASKAYLDVVFKKMALIINRQNMRKLQDILTIAKTKKELGAVSEGDVASIETSVTNSRSELIKVESNYYNAISYYNHFVENDYDKNLPFEYLFDIKLNDLESYIKATIERSYKIQSIQAKVDAAKSGYESYNGSLKPTLDFQLSSDGTLYIGTVTENETNHVAGLKMSYQFLDGGKSKNKKESLRSEIMRQTYKLEEAKKDLAWDTTKLYSSIASALKTNDSTKAEIAAAKKMVNSYWQKYKLASQELDILISAQKQLNNAQLAYVKSLSTSTYGFFKLLSIKGELLSYINNNFNDDTIYYDIKVE